MLLIALNVFHTLLFNLLTLSFWNYILESMNMNNNNFIDMFARQIQNQIQLPA